MHPVLRLIIDYRVLRIYDGVCYLLPSVSRQAMHDKTVFIRQFHDTIVYLKSLKIIEPFFGLFQSYWCCLRHVLRIKGQKGINGEISDKILKFKGEVYPGPALNLYPPTMPIPSWA